MIGQLLTDAPGSSAFFKGGVVAYWNDAKAALLGVPESVLAEHGAVSEPTARAMAEGARARFGTDLAVATTGIAGPTGGSASKPVGLIYVALASAEGSQVRELQLAFDRERNRRLTAQIAIDWVRRHLLGAPLDIPRLGRVERKPRHRQVREGRRAVAPSSPSNSTTRRDAPPTPSRSGSPPRPRGDAVRWVRPESYHVTLRFLGATPRERIADLVAAAQRATRAIAPFELRLGALAGLPAQGPRVIVLERRAARADRGAGDAGRERGRRSRLPGRAARVPPASHARPHSRAPRARAAPRSGARPGGRRAVRGRCRSHSSRATSMPEAPATRRSSESRSAEHAHPEHSIGDRNMATESKKSPHRRSARTSGARRSTSPSPRSRSSSARGRSSP